MDILKHDNRKAASPESANQEDLFPGMSPRNVLDSINDGIYIFYKRFYLPLKRKKT